MIPNLERDSDIEYNNMLSKNKLIKITNLNSIELKKANKFKKKKIKNKRQLKFAKKSSIFLILFWSFIILFFFIFFIFRKLSNKNEIRNENGNENKIKKEKIIYNYYKPILPFNKDDIIVKSFTKTNYSSSNIRYHFHDLFEKRKIFQINYNYLPYTQINRQISFEENANNIYESTGLLNVTKLDIYYNNKNIDTSNFNHIHLAMGFDKK